MKYLDKLFSFRVWALCAFLAGFPALLAREASETLFLPVFWIGFVVILVAYAWAPWTTAVCPWCRKRVKLGATTCHHCGRDV